MYIMVITGSGRGFVSTTRANSLAQKIVAADIALGLDSSFSFYTGDNCQYIFAPYFFTRS